MSVPTKYVNILPSLFSCLLYTSGKPTSSFPFYLAFDTLRYTDTSCGMPIAPYIPYLQLVENVMVFVLSGLASALMLRLLYFGLTESIHLKVRRLSHSLLFYFTLHSLGLIICHLSNYGHVIGWSPLWARPTYDYPTLFVLEMLANSYFVASPVPLLYLTVERCVCMQMMGWSRERQPTPIRRCDRARCRADTSLRVLIARNCRSI